LVEIDDDCYDNCSIDSHRNLSYNSRESRDSHHSHCLNHRNARELTPLNSYYSRESRDSHHSHCFNHRNGRELTPSLEKLEVLLRLLKERNLHGPDFFIPYHFNINAS
jgi:hypothetical protein